MRIGTRMSIVLAVAAALAMYAGTALGSGRQSAAKAPAVAGEWTGTWGVYSPPAPDAPAKDEKAKPAYAPAQLRLDCKVAELGSGKWQATFEGECGRPYKYTVQMMGRQAGGVALFQGTADLGPQDGGVYDWIGRANEKEFVGFFTSEKYTGTFRLAKVGNSR